MSPISPIPLLLIVPMRLIIRQILESGSEFPTFSLDVSPSTPVTAVKELIMELTKLPPSAQHLCCFFNGVKVLVTDTWTVSFYGLEDCSNLFLCDNRLIPSLGPPTDCCDGKDNDRLEAVYLHKVIRVRGR